MGTGKARRPSAAMIVAVLALTGALAGTAVAGPDAITSALTKKKVKKVAKKQANKVFDQRRPDLVRWARIASDGSLEEGFGLDSDQGPTGEYYVTADEPIDDCTAVATGVGNGAVHFSSFPGVGPGHSTVANAYNFHQYDSANNLSNGRISVAVFC
jgi:hypothetical protein